MGRWLFAGGIAFFVIAGCSGGDSSNSSGAHCAKEYDGCICRDKPEAGDVPFAGKCNETAVGSPAFCCKGADYCTCQPVQCGISAVNGLCVCGLNLSLSSTVASCNGTASTCCTQDTGYCYCEDGCVNRFENHLVGSCDTSTDTAHCESGEVQVSSCE